MLPCALHAATSTFLRFRCIGWQLRKACKLLLQGLQSTKDLGVGSLMVAGGLSGVAYWGPVYPADVIKSRMQVDDLKKPQFRGMMDCFRKVSLL